MQDRLRKGQNRSHQRAMQGCRHQIMVGQATVTHRMRGKAGLQPQVCLTSQPMLCHTHTWIVITEPILEAWVMQGSTYLQKI